MEWGRTVVGPHLWFNYLQALDRGQKALGMSKDLKEGVLFM